MTEHLGQSGGRTDEQMDVVLARLRAAWKRWPYMRLCQVVVNVTGKEDPFYVEDDELMQALDTWGP